MDVSPSQSGRQPLCWGRYEALMEEDRGITLPARFRACLGNEVVMVCLPVHAVGILPRTLWEEWTTALAHSEPAEENPDAEVLPAHPESGTFDTDGRLFLSEALCDWATLAPASPLLIVGVGQRVEIWDASQWEQYFASSIQFPDAVFP